MKALSILAILCLTACDQTVASKPEPKPSNKPVDGFGPFKFGSTFEAALDTLGSGDYFNPYSLKKCFDELPLKGCDLYAASNDDNDTEHPYETRDGIGYGLNLSFNKHDKLTDVTLTYRKSEIITPDQCRDIFGRTIDWLAEAYGPVTASNRFKKPKDGEPHIQTRSPGGIAWSYSKPDKLGFVADFVYPVDEQRKEKKDGDKVLVETLNRSFSVLMSYIVVNARGHCDVTVKFSEPDRVERSAI